MVKRLWLGTKKLMYGPGVFIERRKGPDIWVRLIGWFGVIGWLVLLGAMFIAGKAQPHFETFFDRLFHIQVRETWNLQLVEYIFYLMIFGFCISAIGLLINATRHHRKYDRYRDYLVLLGVISLAGIIKHLFF
ncbi:MAG: hypothetical protein ABIH23_18940 [bacterium]